MYNDDLVSSPYQLIDIAESNESNGWKLIKDPLVLRNLCETVILFWMERMHKNRTVDKE